MKDVKEEKVNKEEQKKERANGKRRCEEMNEF